MARNGTESQLDTPAVDELLVLCEEVMRATPDGTHRFVEPAAGVLARAKAKQHSIVFGRRGSGKSSLLRKTVADLTVDRRPVAFVDLETFKGHSYPDVLISVLISTLKEFAKWLDDVATTPSNKKTFWKRWINTAPNRPPFARAATEAVRGQLRVLIEDLEKQLRAPEIAQMQIRESEAKETTNSLGGAAEARVPGAKASINATLSGKSSAGQEKTSSYVHQKVEYLHQNIMKYKDLFAALAALSGGPSFLILDDLYHIRKADQAKVIDYFHRIAKGSNVWLKVGTIKHRSVWYVHGDPPIGVKLNDDVKEIDLDMSLEQFEVLRRFLRKVIEDLMSATQPLSIGGLISKTAVERLIIASGGVARDFVGILAKAISQARNRAKPGDKIGAEDINRGTGDYYPSKLEELKRDSADESDYLEEAFAHLRAFCTGVAKSNVFLVDQDMDGTRRDAVNQLIDLRLVHPVKSRVTLKKHSGGRLFEAYMLDLSQYSAARKVQGIELVELGGGRDPDAMRKSSLIYEGYSGEKS